MVTVAPHVGAWIEMTVMLNCLPLRLVAPHVGAWIEILYLSYVRYVNMSHPTWVRGLKFAQC